MAGPNPSASEMVATTLRNRTGKPADSVSKNNALSMRLLAKDRVKYVTGGGRTIVQEVEYAENAGVIAYSGYDPIALVQSDVISMAEFDYKQYAAPIMMSGLEMVQNMGKAAVIDLLNTRMMNAFKSLKNRVALDLYGDGTSQLGKSIGGLALLISSAPTAGTVGGFNRATASFWRNQKFSALTDGGVALSKTNVQDYMNRLWLLTIRGSDAPDLSPCDNVFYYTYLGSLQAIQRITSDKMASAGFTSLKYMNADVVADGGFGGGAPTGTAYFLNTDYLFLRPVKDHSFVPLGEDRAPTNQDAMTRLLGWYGNMTMSAALFHGVLTP